MNVYNQVEDPRTEGRLHSSRGDVDIQFYSMLQDPKWAETVHQAIRDIEWEYQIVYSSRFHRYETVPRAQKAFYQWADDGKVVQYNAKTVKAVQMDRFGKKLIRMIYHKTGVRFNYLLYNQYVGSDHIGYHHDNQGGWVDKAPLFVMAVYFQ